MRLIKSLAILIICLLLFSSILLIEKTTAEEIPKNNIEAYFDIEVKSATDLKISCEATVSKINVESSGKTYTSEQIESFHNSNNYILGLIAGQLQSLINSTLQDTFKNAKINALNDIPSYKNGKFYDDFNVNLTSSYFGISEDVDVYSFLNGILDMGAQIRYLFSFKAKLGWNNTYAVNIGDDYDFQKQTNGTWDGGTIIEWEIKNTNGLETSKSGLLVLKDKNPTTVETKEDIFLDFQLNATGKDTILQIGILANAIDIQNYNVLPDFVSDMSYIPADGIRLFVGSGLFSWDDVYQNTIKPIEHKIKSNIETSRFNQTLDLVFNWDEKTTINSVDSYDLQNMDRNPIAKAILTDENIDLKIFDISARGLFGLVNTGAKATAGKNDINFGENLNSIGYPYSVSLIIPSDITLDGKNTYTWNDTIAFQGDILSEKSPKYLNEEIETIIEINAENTDLNLLSFFTGQTELIFGLNLRETKQYNVTKVSDKFSLPEQISLDYINSDGLRLCVEEGIFQEGDIDSFLQNERVLFENKLKNTLKNLEINAHVDRDAFYNSLTWDGDINKMDHEKPVKTSSYAYSSYPAAFDLSLVLPSFKIPEQKYYFSGIENQSVKYKMIFPKGISLDVDDIYEKSEVKEMDDGRNYIEISFSPEESNLTVEVTCNIRPSILFILGTLMPCFITLFIAIILIVVVIILRRKKKKRKAVIIEEGSSYGEEEYYVPPPPESK